ncbi:glycosyl transferase [Virgisporangium aliadipatigenens]|uniref:Glycosyl transferase n=1 Tax=Virgisporangium aliadipatigenens TaxID=741659 RepID=A0A8J4DPX6_9ACTN|nr:glycosyltransferase [Virgisporangium aliadipatigenens]GIJ45371.1 glycosyl transferase [Virgisporangium aliadipatigenens]
MKALFTTFPAYGHLLPMLPLARAVAAHGDEAVIAAHGDLHAAATGLPTRPVGPALSTLIATNAEAMEWRSDRGDDADLLAATVALFTTTAADLTFDEMSALVARERPDVLVAEMWDFVTPLVAAKLGIPHVRFTHSPATAVDPALAAGAEEAGAQRDLTVPAPLANVQLWPEWLETQPVEPDDSRIAISSSAYDTAEPVRLPAFGDGRPVVLVTLGTVVDDLELLRSAVDAVLAAGANALVTTGFTTTPEDLKADPERVRAVSFAPIGRLLDRVRAVVAAGGSGTTLATLSRGLPMLFVPRIANQPQIAAAVTAFGAGITPEPLAGSVRSLIDEPSLRVRAEDARDRLAARPSPEAAWSALRARVT